MNHHAHWLAVYNKVSLSLQTHESGGITEKDLEFARMVDDFAD
ncbi:MAG: 4a-hydroxytetrahydrobiopterin dehydratase [Saprospiraceae bacterium]|nr:4a-hydroxytetrahydrobiopterin dehydratase [Saprospiraceae bacterium]